MIEDDVMGLLGIARFEDQHGDKETARIVEAAYDEIRRLEARVDQLLAANTLEVERRRKPETATTKTQIRDFLGFECRVHKDSGVSRPADRSRWGDEALIAEARELAMEEREHLWPTACWMIKELTYRLEQARAHAEYDELLEWRKVFGHLGSPDEAGNAINNKDAKQAEELAVLRDMEHWVRALGSPSLPRMAILTRLDLLRSEESSREGQSQENHAPAREGCPEGKQA